MALSVIIGAIPVLSANAVNAGSVFTTTYGPSDASLPNLTVEQLLRATTFYFRLNQPGILLMLAVGVCLVDIIRRTDAALGAAGITLFSCLLFFLTKEVLIVYYLVPTAVFYLSAAAAHWAVRSESGSVVRYAGAIAAMAVAAMCFLYVFTRVPYPGRNDKIDPAVAAVLRSGPMVWADEYCGYFVRFNRVYAAKIGFASPGVQTELVTALANRHATQLFVTENAEMTSIVSRLSAYWRFDFLGKAYGQDVYALAGPAIPEGSRN
jgi:hypothetical protein